jgi:hypothetical protein
MPKCILARQEFLCYDWNIWKRNTANVCWNITMIKEKKNIVQLFIPNNILLDGKTMRTIVT